MEPGLDGREREISRHQTVGEEAGEPTAGFFYNPGIRGHPLGHRPKHSVAGTSAQVLMEADGTQTG